MGITDLLWRGDTDDAWCMVCGVSLCYFGSTKTPSHREGILFCANTPANSTVGLYQFNECKPFGTRVVSIYSMSTLAFGLSNSETADAPQGNISL